MATSGGNIKVVVRVRPFNNREIDRQAKCIVQMQGNQTVLTPPTLNDPKSKSAKATMEGPKTFAFDKSYWSFSKNDPNYAGQDNLHDDLGKPLLDNAFKGYNNCIFAYGQTGSGKSYSMMGYGQEHGVIPKICRDMFDRIEKIDDKNLSSTVEVSYLEIYNERVRDLLNPSTKGNLRVREHPSTGPYVEDLAKLVVRSFAEIENLMDEGNKARTVAATNMNETSSRSHAVFTLTLTQKRHDVETRMDTEKVAKISLVDLAGSERATSTGATGARLKEGAEINRSLSTLGRVIASLADLSTGKKKAGSMVPYRDSVLTWLLKDSLGGNSLTAMIAAISPADINFEETLSTLRYADSAKRIKNHAVVNEDPNARIIRELKEELAQLRAKLSGGPGGPSEEYYPPDTPLDKQIVTITQSDGTVKKVTKAEIAEQLSQSEKLYQDLNQTWEQKLQKTEQIHKEREAALEELGISIEKGFVGVSTPKKMPHLVNLSDDPLLAECLVYNIKPGPTTVGSIDAGSTAEIRLNGSKILREHCSFQNDNGIVNVVPRDNAAVMVNGTRVDKPTRLRSGYRVILGDFHIFRFNHPEEARAERAELGGSSLRYSVTASQLPSPTAWLGHDQTASRSGSDVEGDSNSRSISPRLKGADSDWSFARREAVSALLGSDQKDQKISNLTDDELDVLFEDLQRVRAGRKKHESRLFDTEDDTDSVNSYPVREKYASNGTIDNFSLDTVLTMPSTPQPGEDDQRLRLVREDMQNQLDQQKEEYQSKLKLAEEAQVEVEVIRGEKARMEENLQELKEEMHRQLQLQKQQFERELSRLKVPTPEPGRLTPAQVSLASRAVERWQQRRYVTMAEKVLQNAALLKEAQVLSGQMDKQVTFQFCIVDVGHEFGSSYDLVLNGISLEDDPDLETCPKPCVGVRVLDYSSQVIHLWSLQKLRLRVGQMRQLYQYVDAPQLSQHIEFEDPFCEASMPQYSRIGDVDVPLAGVFEARVQDFSLDVVSPYTSNVVGIVRLSLEPSSAMAPSTTLKFNVVMRDLIGFAEREGTEIHAQLFVPGISNLNEGGATTTSFISKFDEGPVRFESVHSMSLPIESRRTTMLRISIFAKVTPMHLDKLLSWDDMRDTGQRRPKKKKRHTRLPESEYFSEERHDIFARVQIQEISENGDYRPVDVVQGNLLETGVYQMHQGLQRRIVIALTHSSARNLKWRDIVGLRVGRIVQIDSSGETPDQGVSQRDVILKVVSPPAVKDDADGTSIATVTCQWDSSAHGSLLLDRTTPEKHRVQATLSWSILCEQLKAPLTFSFDIAMQIRPRSFILQPSMLHQLWTNQRIVHSTVGNFSVTIQPQSAKRAVDLWRMNTQDDYVKGEESLFGWAPRGISLVQDYIKSRKQRQRIAEVETARSVLSLESLETPIGHADPSAPYTVEQKQLLSKYLGLWTKVPAIESSILTASNLEPPANGAAFAKAPSSVDSKPQLVGTARLVPKNHALLKGGVLLCPDATHSKWVRRYVELRRPYLHIYSIPDGDEILAINLTHARIDHDPQVAMLLKRPTVASAAVWAVFAPQNSFLFMGRGERDKVEWILKLDESYFSSVSGSGSSSGEGHGE